MTEQPKRNEDLVQRLDVLIAEMKYHKVKKDLANNYHIVLREMINLRDGVQIGY